jgi:hypothetical protein
MLHSQCNHSRVASLWARSMVQAGHKGSQVRGEHVAYSAPIRVPLQAITGAATKNRMCASPVTMGEFLTLHSQRMAIMVQEARCFWCVHLNHLC